MTAAEFRAALETLGLQQKTFAEILGVAPISVNRWARGRALTPRYAVAWLELALRQAASTRKPTAWSAKK